MTDVRLYHTADGGEIEFVNGRTTMSDGLEAAAYLSLFGGNERDDGTKATSRYQWWGNLGETDPARQYRSETHHVLRALPATSANLRRIEEAAARDLAWVLDSIASSVRASARMPALNTVDLRVEIVVNNEAFVFNFAERWGSNV